MASGADGVQGRVDWMPAMLDLLPPSTPAVVSFLLAAVAVAGIAAAVAHALLTKREVRAALGWVGLILVFPVAGAVLYLLFGINRIGRRAAALRGGDSPPTYAVDTPDAGPLSDLMHLVGRVVQQPVTAGNRVVPLCNGEEAYPPMLEAIDGAERTVSLSTYIFDHDEAGKRFRDALVAAHRRGVEVRVIVDAVGSRYSFPPVPRALAQRGVPTAVFLPTLFPWRMPYMNLRTHRKILVADGRTAFVGGINLRDEHLVDGPTKKPVQDLHFRVEGPVVAQIQQVFATDWKFCRGEELEGGDWFPSLEPAGDVEARVIPDGPDGDLDKLRWTLLGALAAARRSVRIVTPYFLPDAEVVTALNVASLRGVDVEVVLPEVNNLTLVHWAATAQLPEILRHGSRVLYTPPPFDHSKVMLVDDAWALVGSANWDPRSLRLNFEIGLECYGGAVCGRLAEIVEAKKEGARPVTAAELEERPLPIRLRDRVAWLAQPYL